MNDSLHPSEDPSAAWASDGAPGAIPPPFLPQPGPANPYQLTGYPVLPIVYPDAVSSTFDRPPTGPTYPGAAPVYASGPPGVPAAPPKYAAFAPPYPAPVYGSFAGYPGGFPPVQRRSGLSVAALCLGIIGLVFSWAAGLALPLNILAIIFGAIGRNRTMRNSGTNDGVGLAGLILGVIGLVLSAGMVFLLVQAGAYT